MEQREVKYASWIEFPKYEVGDDGSVWSLDYNHTGEKRQLKQIVNDEGYKYVFLVVDGKRYKRLCHRMVLISFVPNPENKAHCNHKNGLRGDNRLSNLEWSTPQENALHGYRSNGRVVSDKVKSGSKQRFSGTNNPKAKINEATVLSIRRLRMKGDSLKSIAERHSLSVAQVSSIANNKSWKSTNTLTF